MSKAIVLSPETRDRVLDAVEVVEAMDELPPEKAAGGFKGVRSRYIPTKERSFYRMRLTSIVAGQVGRYNARLITGDPILNPGGALAEANLGTVSGADNAVAWHTPEIKIASAKHLLTTGNNVDYLGRSVGQNSAGRWIMLFAALCVGETAGVTTIGGNTEGLEAADTSTWSRSTNGTPVDIWVTGRTVYNESGDKKLYEYRRKWSFDAAGFLLAISGENRIEVDNPGSCP